MGKFLKQLSAIWSRLEAPQRLTVLLVGVGFAVAAVALGYGATRPDYRLLASGLSPARVAKIAGELEANRTAYRITDNETAILVPSKDLYRLRNSLAETGALGNDDEGFKLLEQSKMWDSTFIEHKNYDRAVAGELEASYKELPGVARARVIIDRPAPSPFVGDEEAKPKASIKLDMQPGMRLSQRQIAGVVHLASGAVAGLSPDRVQVMDSGGLLTQADADSGAAQAQTALDAEMAREAHLTRKAQDLLDTVLGPGRSQVKVSVKLDFTKRSEQTTDPKGLKETLKEDTTTSEEHTPVVGPTGLAGVSANTGDGENAASAINVPSGSKTTEDNRTEYVVGKKTITQEDEVGRIKAMSVSILLDYKSTKGPKLDDKGKPTNEIEEKREEFSPDEKKRFESLVLNAIGFDAAKGLQLKDDTPDAVSKRFTSVIQSMPMYREPDQRTVAEASVAPLGFAAIRDYAGYGLAAIAAIGFLLITRGQLKKSARRVADAGGGAGGFSAAAARAEAGSPQDEAAKRRRQELKDAIRKKVQEDPGAAAQIIKKWMAEG